MTKIRKSKQYLVQEGFGHWILVLRFFGGLKFAIYL
jgi:hypothetical protein